LKPFFSFFLLLSIGEWSYCSLTKFYSPDREPNRTPRMHWLRLSRTKRGDLPGKCVLEPVKPV
jgi:hypothetical protein